MKQWVSYRPITNKELICEFNSLNIVKYNVSTIWIALICTFVHVCTCTWMFLFISLFIFFKLPYFFLHIRAPLMLNLNLLFPSVFKCTPCLSKMSSVGYWSPRCTQNIILLLKTRCKCCSLQFKSITLSLYWDTVSPRFAKTLFRLNNKPTITKGMLIEINTSIKYWIAKFNIHHWIFTAANIITADLHKHNIRAKTAYVYQYI